MELLVAIPESMHEKSRRTAGFFIDAGIHAKILADGEGCLDTQ